MSGTVKIFIAYSRKDSEYLDEIRTHFTPLERSKRVTIWYDGKIEPGSVWEVEIKRRLHSANIILLLVSADSIASDYFYEKEMKDSLERHKKGTARVVPFILRPCAWNETPLGDLQAIPKNAKAVVSWANRDEAYFDAVDRLSSIIKRIESSLKENLETDGQEQEVSISNEEGVSEVNVQNKRDKTTNGNYNEDLIDEEIDKMTSPNGEIVKEKENLTKAPGNHKNDQREYANHQLKTGSKRKWWVGLLIHILLLGTGLFYINPKSKRKILYPILVILAYSIFISCNFTDSFLREFCETRFAVVVFIGAMICGYFVGSIDVVDQAFRIEAATKKTLEE